jgi:hypothetical protein
MSLEWAAEKGAEIPTDLIDRLSYGLFVQRNRGRPTHPTEDMLNALLGASSSVKVSLPGKIEASLNRAGVKRFAKASSEDVAE